MAIHTPKRSVAAGVILTIVLAGTPLLLLNGVFLSHDVIPKVIAVLTGGALLLLLLPQWTSGIGVLWAWPQGRAFLILAAAQAGSLVLSTAASTQPGLSFAGTVWRRFGAVEQIATLIIAVAAAAITALNKTWTTVLFRAVSGCGAVASIYGIFQYFGVDPFLDSALYKLDYFGGVVRPPATMGHAIYFAAWLVPVALIAASSAWSEREMRWKAMHGATAAFASAAIFLSGSRGAVLAAFLAGMFLAVISRSQGSGSFRLQFGAAAAVVVVLIASFVLSPAGAGIRLRLTQWREDPGGARLGMWRESPSLIGAHPVLGAGPETFAGEFRKIESEELSRAYPDFYNETPHNALIDVACAQGIPGFLILSGVFLLGSFRWGRGQSAVGSNVTGLQAAVFGIFVGSLFASFTIVESMMLWTIVGVCVALPITGSKPVREKDVSYLLVPAGVFAGVFLITAVLLSVPDAAYAGLSSAVARKDFDRASEIYATATKWSLGLPLAGYELYASREFAALGRSLGNAPESAKAWGKAAEAAADAEKRSEERSGAAFQSSVLAISAGDLGRAEMEARVAIALAPNWYRPHFFLGQILEAGGRKEEGAAERLLSIRLGAKIQ